MKKQKGSSLIVVLVALALLLLGAASLARVNNTTGLLAGNLASKESSRQAAEIGVSTAFAQLIALTNLEANSASWYFALAGEAEVPAESRWEAAPEIEAGPFTVRYLVERLCEGALPVTDPGRQCFVRSMPAEGSAKAGAEVIESPPSMQFRISVRAEGVKGTSTLVQVLANR